ncbi:MAG: hypothetical protein OJF49_002521 [Ktedonobacterales bacterium]|jgi:tetratricopeptide (TPR) repeat protein|nr:MAG: hypothetical protein OJF49_002521 [Ktedonobacterales bacterium]
MGRHDQRDQRKRQKDDTLPPLTAEQAAQVDTLLAEVPALAQSLHAAHPAGRDALLAALAPVRMAAEPVAQVFAARLEKLRATAGQDAADVSQAVGELDPRAEVAREARRSRIHLRSMGFVPTLLIPASAPATLTPTAATPTMLAAAMAATETAEPHPLTWRERLVEAYVTRSREQGEVSLLLGWQEGNDPNFLHPQALLLDFWHDGLKDATRLDSMSRARFHREVIEGIKHDTATDGERAEMLAISWARARRLVREALDVNDWRVTEPGDDTQGALAQLEARLLAEPDDAEAQSAIQHETDRYNREGDRPYIAGGMEADETVLNWIGGWSLGDYGLSYDLLADDHPMRRKETRDDYIALRRQWARESDPSGLRLTLAREQAKRASALWVPGQAGNLANGERIEMEAFWSLCLTDAPSGGQLDELPMATIDSKETGRHWYWTGYTLARDRTLNTWLLSRTRDEGATSQALTIEELQQRIQESHTAVETITQQAPPTPGSEQAAEALIAITGALTASLHYGDALIARLPLDETVYRAALTDARTLGNHERAAALLERMAARLGEKTQLRFEVGVEQYLVAEQYASQGNAGEESAWLARAVSTLEQVVEEEKTAEHLQGLAELLSRQGHFNQAEARLREALQLEPDRAILHSDLTDALMGRVSGENLDDPVTLSTEERQAIAREALAELRATSQLDPSVGGVFTRMAAIYELLGQPDDTLLALEEAVRRDPGDESAHYALGSLYLTRHRPADALPMLERAVQLSPYNIPARLHLAACYGELGRYGEALRELDLVERLQPGLPEAAELRAILVRDRKKQR